MSQEQQPESTLGGKYALVKLRQSSLYTAQCQAAAQVLVENGVIDFGETEDTAFFVLRLRDKYAAPALAAYALAAYADDPDYGLKVLQLAQWSATFPNRKKPD